MSQEHFRAQDAFGATVLRRSAVGAGSRVKGQWDFECYGPLRLADPGKAAAIITRAGILVPLNVAEGFLWWKQWMDIRRRLQAFSREALVQLERLLSGGELRWADGYDNVVVNVGLDEMLDKFFKGSAYTAAHYVGLTDGAPVTVAAADTMASHAGWSEDQNYSEGARQAFTPGTVSGQSVDNSASKAQFSINATTTIGGGFLTTDSTKGGTAGILVSAGAFTGGDKSVGNGDTLSVQATYTQADDGV